MQKKIQTLRNVLSKFMGVQGSYEDFAAFHSIAWFILGILGIPVVAFLAVRADHWVLQGILNSWWVALMLAIIISLLITVPGYMITNILIKKLHKQKRLDKNDKEIENPQWKYHRSLLRRYYFMWATGMTATLILSFLTYHPAKKQSEGLITKFEQSKEKVNKGIYSNHQSHRGEIIKEYKNDSMALEKIYSDLIIAKSGVNGVKLRFAEQEIVRINKELKNKRTGNKRRKDLKIRKAELGRNIKLFTKNVVRQTRTTLTQKSKKFTQLLEQKALQLTIDNSKFYEKDSTNTSEMVIKEKRIYDNINVSAISVMGHNVALNIILTLLVSGFARFAWGARFGKTPYEFSENEEPQQRRKDPVRKPRKKAPQESPANNENAVARGVSDNEILADLKAAKAKYMGNYRAHKSNYKNEKGTPQSAKEGMAKWQKEIERVTTEIAAIKNKANQKEQEQPIPINLSLA